MKPVILIIGTRPEGIKMIPIYFALKEQRIPVVICNTNQHNNLLDEVFDIFKVKSDISLNIMRPNQDLFHVTSAALEKTKEKFLELDPSLVVVQGDTTSAMAATLSAFYLHIPVAHVEAGLRTKTIHSPFPEEMNRRFISLIAWLHFAPTSLSVGNLLAEGIDRSTVFYTGNTIVDALRLMQEKIKNNDVIIDEKIRTVIDENKQQGKQIVLLTAHRRESFDGGIESILRTIKNFADENPHVFFFYPFHPNPNVLKALDQVNLKNTKNIFLTEPLSYKDLVYVLLHADLVASDSGGICEEASSLGKPVLILRNETERMEAVWQGIAHLVGTESLVIEKKLYQCLDNSALSTYQENTLFGDGYAAQKIVTIIKNNIDTSIQKIKSHKDIRIVR